MSKTKLCITDLALSERPREKLMELGPAALSDAELLAILIGSGNSEETAIDLTRRILKDHHDSLSALGRMGLEELTAYRGMGPAKAVSIMAACELGRRRSKEIVVQHKIKSSQDIADYFQDTLKDLPHEECHMLLMRHNLTVIHETRVSIGGQSSSTVEMRALFQKIFAANAAAIAFCHNHPSGRKHAG